MVTALPLHSQLTALGLSWEYTYVLGTAQTQNGVHPGESKALLAVEVGYGTPFPGTLPV